MLTVKQAARYAGVSPSLVYGWIGSRVLAHYRLGNKGKRGRILIDRADLDSFLDSNRVEPTPPQQPVRAPTPCRPKVVLRHIDLSLPPS
jgi:excisionase family DNA binding protein